jgi:hypothetical protein
LFSFIFIEAKSDMFLFILRRDDDTIYLLYIDDNDIVLTVPVPPSSSARSPPCSASSR